MLKAVVIVLGALIVIALGVLVVGLAIRFSGHGPSGGVSAGYTLPAGATVIEMQTQPNRLVLRVRTGVGEEVDIIDTTDGHLVSQVRAPK
jgi:hypothetical protein